MATMDIQASPRTGRGKGPARRLRASGRFPGVVYGGGQPPLSIALDTHTFEMALKRGLSSSSLVNLLISDHEPQLAIIRELQRDPVDQRLRHVDFYRVRLDQKIEFEVPVHGVGTSPGVKAGGVLEHVTRTVKLRCLPSAVPHHIDVPLEALDFGHSIHVRDLAIPEGVEWVSDPDTVLFSVVVPRATVATEAAAAGEAAPAAEAPAEPEVIGKGKREEEKEEEGKGE